MWLTLSLSLLAASAPPPVAANVMAEAGAEANAAAQAPATVVLYSTATELRTWNGRQAAVQVAPMPAAQLARAPGSNALYYATWQEAGRLDLGSGPTPQIRMRNGGQGIAVASGQLYWGEYYAGLFVSPEESLRRAEPLVSPAKLGSSAGATPHGVGAGMSFDPVGKRLYFITRQNGPVAKCTEALQEAGLCARAIWSAALDGSDLRRVRTLGHSSCLLVEPAGRKLYFSDDPFEGGQEQIWRSNLDGTKPEKLYDLPFTWCSGLAIDASRGHLYLNGSSLPPKRESGLARSSLDGQGLVVVDRWKGGSGGVLMIAPPPPMPGTPSSVTPKERAGKTPALPLGEPCIERQPL